MAAIVLLTVVGMAYTLTGCVAFLAIYRAENVCRPDLSGRNAALVVAWLAVWACSTLAALVITIPTAVVIGAQSFAWYGIGTVLWVQVVLVIRTRNEGR